MRTLIFLLVLAIGGFFWHSRHEKFKEFEGHQLDAKSKEGIVSAKEKQLKDLQAKIEPLRQGEAELARPDGSPEQLDKAVQQLRSDLTATGAKLDSAEDDFLAAVNELREESKKQIFPELKLPNGDVLKNAHITNFKEGIVMVGHEDGVSRLLSDDLPEGWADKFAVDYISRHSKAEIELANKKVQEAVLPPFELKKARLSEIDERIKAVSDQLMAYSSYIRESRRQADLLVRKAFQISMGGSRANAAAAANQREAMFKQAKEMDKQREGTRLQYVELRKQKEELEKQRRLIKQAPVNPQPPQP